MIEQNSDTEVTHKFEIGIQDDECLEIKSCKCGYKPGSWDFTLSIYPEYPSQCPKCKCEFYFKSFVKIYQVRT